MIFILFLKMEISLEDFNSYNLPLNSFLTHYKIIETLGSGAFGIVYKCIELSTGKTFAVKKLPINHSKNRYNNIVKEINLLENLNHPNIVKYYNYFEEDEFIYIIMEYLEGGTLRQFISENSENISEDTARIIIKQILQALSYLHYTCDICHRDIKPENVMLCQKNDINCIKLLDFGLSSDSFESQSYLDNCGTLIYMAPEQIKNNNYSKGVDIWSVGIILYMMLNKGQNPFYNEGDTREEIIEKITNKKVDFSEEFPISVMGKHLIKKLLNKNPSFRYTARPALAHPWITLNKFDKIPMTVFDKAYVDDYVESLKILVLTAIFFFNLDREQTHKKNKSDSFEKNNTKKIANLKRNQNKLGYKINSNPLIDMKKEEGSKEKIVEFDLENYKKKVEDSNKIFKEKFKESREIMFNPKLSGRNELLTSTFIKIIYENKKLKPIALKNTTIDKNSKIEDNSDNTNLNSNSTPRNNENLEPILIENDNDFPIKKTKTFNKKSFTNKKNNILTEENQKMKVKRLSLVPKLKQSQNQVFEYCNGNKSKDKVLVGRINKSIINRERRRGSFFKTNKSIPSNRCNLDIITKSKSNNINCIEFKKNIINQKILTENLGKNNSNKNLNSILEKAKKEDIKNRNSKNKIMSINIKNNEGYRHDLGAKLKINIFSDTKHEEIERETKLQTCKADKLKSNNRNFPVINLTNKNNILILSEIAHNIKPKKLFPKKLPKLFNSKNDGNDIKK